jgi:hypothetical protein
VLKKNMSWTLTTSGAVLLKAGLNANALLIASAASLAKFSDEAEGFVNASTRKDWVADYANVTANFKGMLDDVTSDVIAMKVINYDMSGFTSRQEAGKMLDVLHDSMSRKIDVLKEDHNKEIML